MSIGFHAGTYFVLGSARLEKRDDLVCVCVVNRQNRLVVLESIKLDLLPVDWSWQCETTMTEKYEAHKKCPEIFDLPNYEDMRETCLRNDSHNDQQEDFAVSRLQNLIDVFGPQSEFLEA